MNNKTYTLALVIVFNLCFLINIRANDNLQFYNLNDEYGVSFRQTNMVCSDSNGFIWISSKMGIIRYTQDDVRFYKLPYETVDIISVKLLSQNNDLYAYSNNGQIFRYNCITDCFELIINISKELRNPFIVVDKILIDSKGKLWLATSFGLYSYDKNTGLKSLKPDENVQYIEWYDKDNFFIVLNGEIKLFNIDALTTKPYFSFASNTSYYVASFLYSESQKQLWIGTMADGLLKIDDIKREVYAFPKIPSQPILDIEANTDSTLLLGIDGQGLWEIDTKYGRVLNTHKEDVDRPNSLQGNGVYDVFCGDNERVWVCTYSGGVSYYDQSQSNIKIINHHSNNPNSLVNNHVNAVLEDQRGNIWLATDNGISLWNPLNNTWKTLYQNKREQAQVFLSLCEDDEGRIWAGTYSSGVYLIDGKTGDEVLHLSPETTKGSFGNNFVFSILKDSEGNIWSGGVRGNLICYSADNHNYVSYKDYTVNVMEEFDSENILIGTTYGLLLFNKAKGTSENILEGYLVYDLTIVDDIIWICTSGDGVVKYSMSTKKVEKFTEDDGLSSNFVNSIEYEKGYLWIGTENGICRLSEEDNSIETFSSKHELNSVSVNQNALYKDTDGKLIWGTNKGLITFYPDEVKCQSNKGRIFLQDLTISGRSVREIPNLAPNVPLDSLSELSLRYSQNNLKLEVLPIGVTTIGAKFAWKIDDLEKDWSKPGKNNIISYSNIPSGSYNLSIRMYDNSLAKVIQERSIKIIIIPPYYKSWWFNLFVLSFVGGLGIFLFKYYIHNLKKEHSEEKIRFFANTAHDIRTSLTLINGPIEELNKEQGLTSKALNYLHLATEQTHRLLKVVNHLMDFQKVDVGKEYLLLRMHDVVKIINNRIVMFQSYAKSRRVELVFSSNVDKYVTSIDEVMIEKVIDNLISNAIKYSGDDSHVKVEFVGTKVKWQLEVIDNGIGIDKNAQKLLFKEYYRAENAINSKIVGSGIGLLLVKNYINLHKGKISYESNQGLGSVFRIQVPYVETANKEMIACNNDVSNGYISGFNKAKRETRECEKLKMKVLVVEDNEYLQEFLCSALNDKYEIYLASDGIAGWEILMKEVPDLIVSDIMMPNMDGFELCTKVKSTYETSHIPIILLTALADKAQHLKGLGLGADDYLTKPFDITILQQRIKTIIKNRKVLRDKALKIIKIDDSEEPILENKLNDKFIKQMVKVVRENVSNSDFSKNDFAAKMNVSSSLLYKKVKALTNQSPTDFIKTIRLDYSLELLKKKEYTITEISEMCGFSSVGYFSTVFRKHFKKSPSQLL